MNDEVSKKEKRTPDTERNADTEMSDAASTLTVEDRITDDFAIALVAALSPKDQTDLTLSANYMNMPHLAHICRMTSSMR